MNDDWIGPHTSGHSDGLENNQEIEALRRLVTVSPPLSLSRFRKRAAVFQGTRMLFETQVIGFWLVLDAFLRLALGARPAATKSALADGDKQ